MTAPTLSAWTLDGSDSDWIRVDARGEPQAFAWLCTREEPRPFARWWTLPPNPRPGVHAGRNRANDIDEAKREADRSARELGWTLEDST